LPKCAPQLAKGRDGIQVYRIPIPKDSLLKLPKEERICLLQLGHMANQVLMRA
jgi:hypothetical protein